MRGITVAVLYARLMADTGQFTTAMAAADGRLEKTAIGAQMVGANLFKYVSLPLAVIGGLSTKLAVDFQTSMELIHTQAHKSQEAVNSLSKEVLTLAGPTATAPDELAKGLYHLASQGLATSKIMGALQAAAEGAKLGGANLEDVTNALGATLVSKIGGVTSYTQAMGVLNSTVGAGDMYMQQLAEALGTGLPSVAAIAGVSLQQVGGALATLGDNNIRGAKAGTLLISALRILGHQSQAGSSALLDLGVSGTVLQQKLAGPGGLQAAIGYLHDKIGSLGPMTAAMRARVGNDLSEAFGGKQSTGVKILVDQFGRLKTKIAEVSAGGKSFASDWAAYTQTTSYHMAAMGAGMRAAGINLGDILLPILSTIVDYIGKVFTWWNNLSSSMRKIIGIALGVAAAIGPLIWAFGVLAGALAVVATPIGLFVTGLALLVGAIAAAVLAPSKLQGALEHLGLSAHASGEVVKVLQDVFNGLKTASEWVAGEIRTHWDTIRAIFVHTWEGIKVAFAIGVKVFHTVVSAGEWLVGAVRAHWQTISSIFSNAWDIIKTIVEVAVALVVISVETAVGVIQVIWRNFGGMIISILETAWTLVVSTVKNALQELKGVFEFFDGLIHGDWSKMWSGIKDIVGGTLKEIWALLKAAVSTLGAVVEAIGMAIYNHILKPIGHLARDLWNTLKDAILWAIHILVDWVPSEAAQVGKAIADGIISGATHLGSGLLGVLKGGVGSAWSGLKSGFGIFSPSRVFAETIGKPLAEGIIVGFLEGTASLPSTMSKAVTAALTAAQAATSAQFNVWQTQFQRFTSYVDQAFQGITAAHLTPAGKKLASLQSAHDDEQRQNALSDANKQVSAAQAALAAAQNATYANAQDQANAIAQAQDQLTTALRAQADAQYQIQVAALQKKSDAEQKQYTAARNLQQQHMDDLLAHYETMMAKQPQRAAYWQEKITKSLQKYGVTYKSAGTAMGHAFAIGLKESENEIKTVMIQLAKMMARYLKLHSPADEGPLSDLDQWWKPFARTLTSGLDLNAVRSGANALAGQARVSMGVGNASAFIGPSTRGAQSGGVTIVVPFTGNTFLTDERSTLRAIADALAKVSAKSDSRLQMAPS